jgi:hypothetical protein
MEFFEKYEWFAIGAVVVFVSIVFLSMRASHGKKLLAAVEAVADRFGATVKPGSGAVLTTMPQLHFIFRDHPVGLTFISKSQGSATTYITRLYIELPSEPEMEIRLEPEDFFSKIKQSVAGEDIQVGDTDFDKRYTIRGLPVNEVQRLLSAGVREAIEEVRRLGGDDHLQLSTYKNYFRVQKYSWIDEADSLALFIESGKKIFDGFLG